jgi:hypothetical protein
MRRYLPLEPCMAGAPVDEMWRDERREEDGDKDAAQ